jgi:hypothetical protein
MVCFHPGVVVKFISAPIDEDGREGSSEEALFQVQALRRTNGEPADLTQAVSVGKLEKLLRSETG